VNGRHAFRRFGRVWRRLTEIAVLSSPIELTNTCFIHGDERPERRSHGGGSGDGEQTYLGSNGQRPDRR
jgi:hypothetical protein